jgi:hypothetical protein
MMHNYSHYDLRHTLLYGEHNMSLLQVAGKVRSQHSCREIFA